MNRCANPLFIFSKNTKRHKQINKSPNIFFKDVMDADDAFFDKCLEGFVMFALNQGEVCTCPSRALIHESIYDQFMEES